MPLCNFLSMKERTMIGCVYKSKALNYGPYGSTSVHCTPQPDAPGFSSVSMWAVSYSELPARVWIGLDSNHKARSSVSAPVELNQSR
jgi:hypothetical protein